MFNSSSLVYRCYQKLHPVVTSCHMFRQQNRNIYVCMFTIFFSDKTIWRCFLNIHDTASLNELLSVCVPLCSMEWKSCFFFSEGDNDILEESADWKKCMRHSKSALAFLLSLFFLECATVWFFKQNGITSAPFDFMDELCQACEENPLKAHTWENAWNLSLMPPPWGFSKMRTCRNVTWWGKKINDSRYFLPPLSFPPSTCSFTEEGKDKLLHYSGLLGIALIPELQIILSSTMLHT